MFESKKLFELIQQVSGLNNKAQIGALFREFQGITNPKTAQVLKTVYLNNIYSDKKYPDKSMLEKQSIKDNCSYIRRCSILAMIEHSKSVEDSKLREAINRFLFSCINDPAHEVRQAVFNIASKEFNETQLIESYNKIRAMASEDAISNLIKDEYNAMRRGIIRALGEKISFAEETVGKNIIKFIHSILKTPRDNDPYVCAAAAEILGNHGSVENIEVLQDIIHANEYPAHLRAEQAIKQIKKREKQKDSIDKIMLYKKIQSLEHAIQVLQSECQKYKKDIDNL
jgi:HEAT repeat protein